MADLSQYAPYLTGLYQSDYGRAPDAAGLQYWEQQMANGETPDQISQAFMNSGEYASAHPSAGPTAPSITGPVSGGVDVSAPSSGGSLGPLMGSGDLPNGGNDPTAYVTSLYQQDYGRAPDPAGLQFWTQQINGGEPLGQIQQDFMNSPEYASYHSGPSSSGTTPSSGPSSAPSTNSDPYVTFLDSLYQQDYGRSPDAAGLSYWDDQLKNGMPESQVTQAFGISPEFGSINPEQFLSNLYQTDYNRAADPAGLQYWEQQLKSGVAPQDIINAFNSSQEYAADHPGSSGGTPPPPSSSGGVPTPGAPQTGPTPNGNPSTAPSSVPNPVTVGGYLPGAWIPTPQDLIANGSGTAANIPPNYLLGSAAVNMLSNYSNMGFGPGGQNGQGAIPHNQFGMGWGNLAPLLQPGDAQFLPPPQNSAPAATPLQGPPNQLVPAP